jgi:hypothetical protein
MVTDGVSKIDMISGRRWSEELVRQESLVSSSVSPAHQEYICY